MKAQGLLDPVVPTVDLLLVSLSLKREQTCLPIIVIKYPHGDYRNQLQYEPQY